LLLESATSVHSTAEAVSKTYPGFVERPGSFCGFVEEGIV
jgi:hypothetical protein